MSRRLAALALFATLAAATPAAADDEITGRKMTFAERGKHLIVTTTFGELFDPAALDALSSGFPTTVVVRTYVYTSKDELPVSLAVVQIDVVYDLWDEIYVVRVQSPLGSSTTRHPSRARVVAAVTALRELPIAPLTRIAIGPHHFCALVAELNPVSEELQIEMKRWLTRRAGEGGLDSGSSFFGSFVSVFVNPKLQAADRVIRLRSQPFYRVAR